MCGIAGIFNLKENPPVSVGTLKSMALTMRHRGPEETGVYSDQRAGLAHSRLSIIDIATGQQPVVNEDESKWIVCNGEIFNYPELRDFLIAKGHRFRTKSDTEVILHLFEEYGPGCLEKLNGQFAFAIWDNRSNELFLARDRFGISPLFYTIASGSLIFASEIKALLADSRVKPALDPKGLDQLYRFWANIPPRTVFRNISELPPAHYMIAKRNGCEVRRYWDIDFGEIDRGRSIADWSEGLTELLKDSVRIRLRADVPVGSYLSGGMDSSLITAIVRKFFRNDLKTFSINFSDKWYDERVHQDEMIARCGTEHRRMICEPDLIAKVMPNVVYHSEKPLIRTAPAPMYLLSSLVRENGYKVVLTGEGADEMLGGYDIFREMKIRNFWAKEPGSETRPRLFGRLYSYLPNWQKKASPFIEGFYRNGLLDVADPYYSHRPRWAASSWRNLLYSSDFKSSLAGYEACSELDSCIPEGFLSWSSLGRAQYLEMKTLLSGNLLSSQGDRMLMANSVEGRFPFLDHRIAEYCAKMPPGIKLKALNEKYILKKSASGLIPETILTRPKQGYRSPESSSFFSGSGENYISELLSRKNIIRSGIFDPASVERLVKVSREGNPMLLGAKHNMAVTAVITTMLMDHLFISKSGVFTGAQGEKAGVSRMQAE